MKIFHKLLPLATGYFGVSSALYDFDGLVVIYGPAGGAWHINIEDEPRWYRGPATVVGAGLLEMDVILGNEDKFIDNIAKVGLHFESILIRGLMNYAFWVPNGSPEYRYCLHESVEECNHTMMFQEMVNRIGADVPGMPRMLKWLSQVIPLAAGPLPIVFFFGVLAGEEPIDHTQKNVLREGKALHPIMERVMAIHVAEEARHISFAHEYLRKRVPHMRPRKRFWLSLHVPIIMRVLCQAIVVPPRAFWKEFDIPRSVRKELFFRSPESRRFLRDMFGDVRMLCDETGLMNPAAKLVWRICKINGEPSRYRSEPQRQHLTQAPQAHETVPA